MSYGITWGTIKRRCEQEITASRLPIDDLDAVVYTAITSVAAMHNEKGSPIFTRWNGAQYEPQNLIVAGFPIQTPFAGLEIPNDADHNLDNPIYRVYSAQGDAFTATSLSAMIDKRNSVTTVLTATDADNTVYELTANSSALVALDASDENLYAAVGNVLYVYPAADQKDILEINYMYYFVPPYPENDATIVRIPLSLLEFIVLTFKTQYLAKYGQLLDWRSQQRLEYFQKHIRTGD